MLDPAVCENKQNNQETAALLKQKEAAANEAQAQAQAQAASLATHSRAVDGDLNNAAAAFSKTYELDPDDNEDTSCAVPEPSLPPVVNVRRHEKNIFNPDDDDEKEISDKRNSALCGEQRV